MMTRRDAAPSPRRRRYADRYSGGGRASGSARRKFACQAQQRRLCKLIAFGSFPRHRPVRRRREASGRRERAERTDARARRAPFPPPSLPTQGVCGRKRGWASPTGGRRCDLERAAGALNGAPRMATRQSPPSFRVAMPESPALIPTDAPVIAPAARAARLRRDEVRRRFRPVATVPVFVIPQPIGAARAAQTPLSRASRAASSRRERIYHVKQDDYRRLPPGRDPGGRAEG